MPACSQRRFGFNIYSTGWSAARAGGRCPATTSIVSMRDSAKLNSVVTMLRRISILSEIDDGTLVEWPLRMLALIEGWLRSVADVG